MKERVLEYLQELIDYLIALFCRWFKFLHFYIFFFQKTLICDYFNPKDSGSWQKAILKTSIDSFFISLYNL